MTIDVDYLSPQAIEREANALLASFEAKHGEIGTIHTPLDEIVESHLGLTCEMANLGHEAILGQIDIEDGIIRINESLDPFNFSGTEGRYNFTLAHEAGHWVLHRSYVEKEASFDLFSNKPDKLILCRKEDRKAKVEIQADMFASYLLMPAEKMVTCFQKRTGANMLSIPDLYKKFLKSRLVKIHWNEDEVLGEIFQPMAESFKVSKQAMVIRLKKMGLLYYPDQGRLTV